MASMYCSLMYTVGYFGCVVLYSGQVTGWLGNSSLLAVAAALGIGAG